MSRHVIALINDLFFTSKIRATAEGLGISIRSVRTPELLLSAAREARPDLIIINLEAENVNTIELAKTIVSDTELNSIPIIGFSSHVLVDLQNAAKEAGYTRVLPRSAFTSKLPEILSGAF
jgi:CheY-like chemotaxis protein